MLIAHDLKVGIVEDLAQEVSRVGGVGEIDARRIERGGHGRARIHIHDGRRVRSLEREADRICLQDTKERREGE